MRYVIKWNNWYLKDVILHGVFAMDMKWTNTPWGAKSFVSRCDANEIYDLLGGDGEILLMDYVVIKETR